MDITEQFYSSLDRVVVAERDDMVAITYTTGNIDGTESHAVRRIEWISGNVTGNAPLCTSRRRIREVSLGYAEQVTCSKCLKRAVKAKELTK